MGRNIAQLLHYYRDELREQTRGLQHRLHAPDNKRRHQDSALAKCEVYLDRCDVYTLHPVISRGFTEFYGCIIQDSKEDWEQEGSKMNEVYSGSYLTVSADDAPGAQSGFIHSRNVLAGQSCIHSSLVSPYAQKTPGPYHSDEVWGSDRGELKPGLPVPQGQRVICCGIGPADRAMNTCLLSRRDWILQERLLSPRVLHRGAQEVSWECNQLKAWERKPTGKPYPSRSDDSWDKSRPYAQLNT
jgi:hypothetical protein